MYLRQYLCAAKEYELSTGRFEDACFLCLRYVFLCADALVRYGMKKFMGFNIGGKIFRGMLKKCVEDVWEEKMFGIYDLLVICAVFKC